MTPCVYAEVCTAGMRRSRLRETDGAVTILMTVVTVLILSLILVSLESARQQGAVAMLHLQVQTAAESVLGEYYAPLFDRYGLYGLYDVDIVTEIQDCLETSGRPEQSGSYGSSDEDRSYYSYAFDVSEVALTKTVKLLDGGGAICRNQMIEEGAISGVQELAELLLRSVKMLKESEQSVEALEEQQKVQRELAAFDSKLLQLTQLIDGIQTDSSGVVFQDDGKPAAVATFVKRAVTSPPTASSVKVNNEMFFERMEPVYTDVITLSGEFCHRIQYLADAGGEVTDPVVRLAFSRLFAAARESLFASQEAIPIIDELISMQDRFRPMVTSFETYLTNCEALIDEDIYKSMQETLRILKGYVGAKDGVKTYDFAKMKTTLQRNIEVLQPIYEKMLNPPIDVSDWHALGGLDRMFSGYSLEGLELDYSTVRKSTADNTSFWAKVKSIVTNGITGGAYDPDVELSTASIRWEPELPSTFVEEDVRSLYVFPGLVEDGSLSVSLLQELMKGNLLHAMLNRVANGVEELSEKLLLIAYFTTHMTNFRDESPQGVLHYEQEYLLFGKYRDDQNQRSATLAILGIRALMNIVHVLTDAGKQAETLAVASELLAAVPFPLAIKVVQYLIAVVWAIQNAYLETAEILLGKEVPLVVTTGSFQLSLSGSVLLSREKRIEIAKEYQPPEGLKLGYTHYLLLFMLLRDSDTMVGRALDLIQTNIRAEYDEDFRIRDCVYGFEAGVTAEVAALYTSFSFGGTGLDRITSYTIQEECALSY